MNTWEMFGKNQTINENNKEVDYDDDYQDMVRRVGEKAKAADALKAQGKEPQTKFNPKTGKYYVDFGQDKPVKENAEELNIGDPVIITGNVEFEGKTGDIIAFGQDKRFVVVNLYNHGKHSFHSSDVSFNDYADSDEEESRMYEAGYGRNRGYTPGIPSPHAPTLGGRRHREDDEYHVPDPVAPTWYIRANGKIIKDKMGTPFQYRDKDAATKAARTMMAKPFNAGKKFTLTTKPVDDQPENEAVLHTKYKRNRFTGVQQRDQAQDELSNIAMNRVSGMDESKERCPQCGMTGCTCKPGTCKCKPIKGWIPNKGFRDAVDEAGSAAQQAAIAINMKKHHKKPKDVDEGKRQDNYHIVNKDGKPASLASYADKDSAVKDRDAKHPGAEVRQVGPRGKVKSVSEGVAESLPLNDAMKLLRQYGADHFKTGSESLKFYKDGRAFSVDLVWNDDATRSVTLSSLNSATRKLKGQGVAEGSEEQWTVTVGTKTGGTSHTMTFAGTKEQAIKKAVARFGTSKNPVVKAVPAKQGVAEGSELKQVKRKYNQAAKDANTDQVGAGKKIDTMKKSLRQKDLNKQVDEERTETKNEKGEVTSWRDESDWRKVSKDKDGRGRVTNLSDKARRATEKLTTKPAKVNENSQATMNQVYQHMIRQAPNFMKTAPTADVKKAISKAMAYGTQISVPDLATYAYGMLKTNDLDEGWKSKLGGAALAGAMALGGSGAHAQSTPSGEDFLPSIIAHVTFKVNGNTVTKDINLGHSFKSPGEASAALEKFLKSKGIKFYDFTLERVSDKESNNSYLEKTPVSDTGASGSMDSGPYSSAGSSSNNYMAKESIDEAIDRAVKSMAEDGYEFKESLRTENPCWKGYKPVGTKKKNGRTVPNCVPT